MQSPEEIVNAQLDAYNSRDTERFLSFYADDTVLRDADGTVLMDGKLAMRERYGRLFSESPNIHCTIANRSVLGPYIIDHEIVIGRAGGNIRAVVVYFVKDEKITHVTLAKQIL